MVAPNHPPAEAPEGVRASVRRTLAMRIAERGRQRELRAERLARACASPDAGAPAPEALAEALEPVPAEARPALAAPRPALAAPRPALDTEAADALEHFLRALTGPAGGAATPASPPAAVLPFQRPEPGAEAPSDLGRLKGAGPGLVRALERAGVRRLADLAPLEPGELATRLGPVGRLVPAAAWIEAARAAG